MKANVFHKPKHVSYDDVPDPIIQQPTDIILKVTSTAICGSDLHIYNGFFPQPKPMVLGHEFMGFVEEVGPEVRRLKKGDRVVVPFPIACGQCYFCAKQLTTNCENSNPKYGPEGAILHDKGAALFGYTDLYGGYDGGQAEAVRVPFADFGPRVVPEQLTDEQILFTTDILPTGWASVDWAQPQPGDTIAVFGCGPVGLMAQKSAWLQGAGRVIGIDILPYRLEMARRTTAADVINAAEVDPVEAIREMTNGRGADICIDAVGMEAHRTFLDKVNATIHGQVGSDKVLELCMSAVRRNGSISIVGVYGSPYDNFPLDKIFEKGLRISAGQVPVHKYIDKLMQLIVDDQIITDDIITHRMPLIEVSRGFEIFNEKQEDCVKVVLKP
jgi:S-(hydroxymethyl)glutathione dehydrogenase / alcohol dehydrogenase